MRIAILLACVLTLTSCSGASVTGKLTCDAIDGIEQVLESPGVFIGDMHGTVESPAFLSDLSCHALRSGRPLVVAMEYDADDQAVLDDFLRITDDSTANARLTGTRHWTGNVDGRASPAMRDALMDIRRYALGGGLVELIAYDLKVDTWQERDTASAEYISRLKAARNSDAFWIVFGGNVHARRIKGLPIPGQEDHEPLGYQIRDWNLIHLNASYQGGTVWGCVGPNPDDCKVMQWNTPCTSDCPAQPVIRLTRSHPAYDGVYEVGKLTASPPLHRRQ